MRGSKCQKTDVVPLGGGGGGAGGVRITPTKRNSGTF